MKNALNYYRKQLDEIREAGTFKAERVITTPQRARIDTTKAHGVINMCANNYLGLGDDKRLIEAAKKTYDEKGYGLASVRFICGTQDIHKQLEKRISSFLGMDDTILYSSCFDANGGLFETILTAEDAVISDELNHASIIDGVRLCKAKRYRYHNNDMADLRAKLEEADAAGARIKLIATDGVFSMDGIIADLKGICDLADERRSDQVPLVIVLIIIAVITRQNVPCRIFELFRRENAVVDQLFRHTTVAFVAVFRVVRTEQPRRERNRISADKALLVRLPYLIVIDKSRTLIAVRIQMCPGQKNAILVAGDIALRAVQCRGNAFGQTILI